MRKFTKEEIAAKIASAKIYAAAHPEIHYEWAAAVAELNSRTYIGESGAYTTPIKEGDLIRIDENEAE